ncbi:MAG TPA: serine hydrolase domain-containing protein [Acidimicrobiales bacterium]|nr:serine hydrolase domain-containing protein [Acidimicrobiales bacterium]
MTLPAGSADQRFAAVREAFAENFDDGELGASCCVIVGGTTVVDLWGGWADGARTRPWRADTLCNAYSVGKPLVALSVLQQVATGRVDLDAAADRSWPGLIAGQRGATVRHALSHQAGVPAIREPLTNDDLWVWDRMAAAVAGTEPWWEPGTRHAYHTNTYGHLVGELGRRLTGLLPGDWLRTTVAGPLGADVHWGVTDTDLDRCAEVVWELPVAPPAAAPAVLDGLPEERRMVLLGYTNPPGYSSMGVMNTLEWRQAQVPSTNLHASARGIARSYQGLLAGDLLDADVLAEATSVQSEGWCPVLERDAAFGLGFQPTRPERQLGPNPRSYGHFGTGGALGFADPDAGVAFGYVMNAVKPRWQSTRNRRLIEAVYSCL